MCLKNWWELATVVRNLWQGRAADHDAAIAAAYANLILTSIEELYLRVF
jgi:hypothetical protein